MEIFGARFDEEYESFSTNMFDNPNLIVHESFNFPSDNIFSNIDYFNPHFQESCDNTGIDMSAAIGDHRPYNNGVVPVNSFHDHLCFDNTFEPMSFYDGLILPDNAMGDTLKNVGSEEDIQLKRKYEEEPVPDNKSDDFSPDCPKKKRRISKNKDQRSVQKSKGKKKVIENKNITTNEEGLINNSIGNNTQSLSSGCSSDQDYDRISNGSREVINGEGSTCVNPDGKAARASRGSATDPQSLYARRRRERISERLKILQNLVPNGTKVDISTMLEEAVHYVKFLQLQIKLLSSDDMWMYAPIANNGMELGMFHKVSSTNV